MNPWLLAAPILPLGLVAAGLLLMRVHQRQQAEAARIKAVVSPVATKRVDTRSRGIARQDLARRKTWKDHLGSIFGFNPAKADQYRVPWPMVLLITGIIARIIGVLAAGFLGSLMGWLLVPISWILLSRTTFGRTESKRRTALLKQFPDALSLIVRAVRVGIPVTESLRAVAREAPEPTRAEFDRVVDQIGIGTTPDQALRDLADRTGLPEYGFFAAALTLQAQTGGGLTETLELLADVIRKRVAMKARGFALSAEARTSALVLGCLPIVTGCIIGMLSPDYMAVLFTDRSGNIILGIAILSLSAGMFAMQTIIRKSLS